MHVFRKLSGRYNVRVIFINVICFVFCISIYGIYAYKLARSAEIDDSLKKYDDALSQIASWYDRKTYDFNQILMPVFYSQNTKNSIYAFYTESMEQLFHKNPFMISDVNHALREVCMRDSDIYAALLYKPYDDTMYCYYPSKDSLSITGDDFPFYFQIREKTARRTIYGMQTIQTGTDFELNSTQVFGIAGSFIELPGYESRWNNIMLAYKTSGIDEILRHNNLGDTAYFSIITDNRQIVYSNNSEITQLSLFGDIPYDNFEHGIIKKDNVSYYYKTLLNERGSTYIFYAVPIYIIHTKASNNSITIIFSIVVIACIAFVIGIVSIQVTKRKIAGLEDGIRQVGLSNLGYRIPVTWQNDEYTRISIKFNQMCDELQSSIERGYKYYMHQREAQLYALQTSINPHFLFNTLESIRIRFIDDGLEEQSNMLVMLSRLIEYQFKGDSFVTLDEELLYTQLYIDFFKIRLEGSFDFWLDVDDDTLICGIPRFTLQPIVENFFIHGISMDRDNKLKITCKMENDQIFLEIRDDGVGICSENLNRIRTKLYGDLIPSLEHEPSIGLQNVQQRLRIIYGDDSGLTIESNGVGYGTIISIKLLAMTVDELKAIYPDKTLNQKLADTIFNGEQQFEPNDM